MIRPTTDQGLDELTCQAMREVKKADFPHFSEQEFGLLPAYHLTIGTLAFDSFVKAQQDTQHTMLHEYLVGRQSQASYARGQSVKLDVSLYDGGDTDSLPRWFTEIEVAIVAGQITEENTKGLLRSVQVVWKGESMGLWKAHV